MNKNNQEPLEKQTNQDNNQEITKQDSNQDNNQENHQENKQDDKHGKIIEKEITSEEDFNNLISSLGEDPEEFKTKLEEMLNDPDKLNDIFSQDINLGDKKVKIVANVQPDNKFRFKNILNIFLNFILFVLYFGVFSIILKTFNQDNLLNYLVFTLAYSILTMALITLLKKKLILVYSLFSMIIDTICSLIIFIILYLVFNKFIQGTFSGNFGIMLLTYCLSIACWIFTNRYIKSKIAKKIFKNKNK